MSVLSDGKTDGVILMYCKDGVVYPVAIEKEQSEMLSLLLPMAFGDKPIRIFSDKPQGKAEPLLKERGKQ